MHRDGSATTIELPRFSCTMRVQVLAKQRRRGRFCVAAGGLSGNCGLSDVAAGCGSNRKGLPGWSGDAVRLGVSALLRTRPPRFRNMKEKPSQKIDPIMDGKDILRTTPWWTWIIFAAFATWVLHGVYLSWTR